MLTYHMQLKLHAARMQGWSQRRSLARPFLPISVVTRVHVAPCTLQAPNDATLKSVGEATASLGMFAVTGFSDEAVAHSALSSLVSCAARSQVSLRQVGLDRPCFPLSPFPSALHSLLTRRM